MLASQYAKTEQEPFSKIRDAFRKQAAPSLSPLDRRGIPMTKIYFLAALPLVLSFTVSATAQQLPREGGKYAVRGTNQIVVQGTDKSTAPRLARFRDPVDDDPFRNMHFE